MYRYIILENRERGEKAGGGEQIFIAHSQSRGKSVPAPAGTPVGRQKRPGSSRDSRLTRVCFFNYISLGCGKTLLPSPPAPPLGGGVLMRQNRLLRKKIYTCAGSPVGRQRSPGSSRVSRRAGRPMNGSARCAHYSTYCKSSCWLANRRAYIPFCCSSCAC